MDRASCRWGGGNGGNEMRWIGWDRMRPRGACGACGDVCLASSGVGLGSLCCRRGSSGLFHLLGWLPMCSEGLKTGPVAGRSYSL